MVNMRSPDCFSSNAFFRLQPIELSLFHVSQ
jgi:hypothetical protein